MKPIDGIPFEDLKEMAEPEAHNTYGLLKAQMVLARHYLDHYLAPNNVDSANEESLIKYLNLIRANPEFSNDKWLALLSPAQIDGLKKLPLDI
jgi:hypothetical protein